MRYVSSDYPEIQSASQSTQAWEILDIYIWSLSSDNPESQSARLLYTSMKKGRHLYYDNPEIQSASLLYTIIGNVTYLSSDNPEIQSSSHYSQGLEILNI